MPKYEIVKKNKTKDQKGFASIQFVVLMGFTILFLTGFLNILFIEYQRNSAITSLRDAARAGTRIVDLRTGDPIEIEKAKQHCASIGNASLKDLSNDKNLSVVCDVAIMPNKPAQMLATLKGTPKAVIVPWAAPYSNIRLQGLSKSFVQRGSANE